MIRFKVLTRGLGGCGFGHCLCVVVEVMTSLCCKWICPKIDRQMVDRNSGASCQILIDLKCSVIPCEQE